MLKIKKILLKNFMSHGGVPMIYNLDEHNLTLVVGPNGAGKSSAFLDALFFGFYGKPYVVSRKLYCLILLFLVQYH